MQVMKAGGWQRQTRPADKEENVPQGTSTVETEKVSSASKRFCGFWWDIKENGRGSGLEQIQRKATLASGGCGDGVQAECSNGWLVRTPPQRQGSCLDWKNVPEGLTSVSSPRLHV